jgi:hypothetical protein
MRFSQQVLKEISKKAPIVIERDTCPLLKNQEDPAWAKMKICPARWRLSRPIFYVIYNSANQLYLVQSLRHYHYQQEDIESLETAVAKVNTSDKNRLKLEIIKIHSSQEYFSDGFLSVFNFKIDAVPNILKWSEVSELLSEKAAKVDLIRKNKCRDFGFTGDRNCKRDNNPLGISHADVHAGTKDCRVIGIMIALSVFIQDKFPDLGIYMDDLRQEHFAGILHRDNIIEAIRVHETDFESSLLSKHMDIFNCLTANYSWVMTLSHFVQLADNTLVRQGVTTYGKDSANRYMKQLSRFMVPIQAMQKLYNAVPVEMRDISIAIFPEEQNPRRVLPFCHVDKGVLYSLVASAMQRLWCKYAVLQTSLEMAAAFYSAIPRSECFDHFWQVCDLLFENGMALCDRNNSSISIESVEKYYEFGFALHMHIYKMSLNAPYHTKQRHQPHCNMEPDFEKSKSSMDCLITLLQQLHTLRGASCTGQNMFMYYEIAFEIIRRDVHGAGFLTANHVLGPMAYNQDAPAKFAEYADIARSTGTADFLLDAFGLSRDDPHSDFRQLLKALAASLGISVREAEELCCLLKKVLESVDPTVVNFANIDFVYEVGGERFRMLPDGTNVYNIDYKSVTRYADVVYAKMLLLTYVDGKIHALDKSGVVKCVQPMIFDAPSLEWISLAVDYWDSNKRCFKRSFDYKRSSRNKITYLGEYFTSRDIQKPSRTLKRELASPCEEMKVTGNIKVALDIRKKILLPSYETICQDFQSRRPLDIRKLVLSILCGEPSVVAKTNDKRQPSKHLSTVASRLDFTTLVRPFSESSFANVWVELKRDLRNSRVKQSVVDNLEEAIAVDSFCQRSLVGTVNTDKNFGLASHGSECCYVLPTGIATSAVKLGRATNVLNAKGDGPSMPNVQQEQSFQVGSATVAIEAIPTIAGMDGQSLEPSIQHVQQLQDTRLTANVELRTVPVGNIYFPRNETTEELFVAQGDTPTTTSEMISLQLRKLLKMQVHDVPFGPGKDKNQTTQFFSAYLKIPEDKKKLFETDNGYYYPPPTFSLFPTGEDEHLAKSMLVGCKKAKCVHVANPKDQAHIDSIPIVTTDGGDVVDVHRKKFRAVMDQLLCQHDYFKSRGLYKENVFESNPESKLWRLSDSSIRYQERRAANRKAHRKKKRALKGKWHSMKAKHKLQQQVSSTPKIGKQSLKGEPSKLWKPRTNKNKGKPCENHKSKKQAWEFLQDHKISRMLAFNNRLVRCFADKEDAIQFCLLAFLFAYSHCVDKSRADVKSLFFIRDSDSSANQKKSSIVLEGIREYRVFYNPGKNVPGIRKFKEPFLVAVQYEAGGLAYYLCNGNGMKQSNALLSMPSSVMTKRSQSSSSSDDTFEMIEIIDHKVGRGRSHCYPKCSVNVVLQGIDGFTIEEPLDKVFSEAPYHCYLYAKRKNLLHAAKWKNLFKKNDYSTQEEARNVAIGTTNNIETSHMANILSTRGAN